MSGLARVVGCNTKTTTRTLFDSKHAWRFWPTTYESKEEPRRVNTDFLQVAAFEVEAKAERSCRSWSSMAGAGSVRQLVHEVEHDHDARPHCSADAVEHYSHSLLSLSLGRFCSTATLRSNKALEAAAMPTLWTIGAKESI